MTGPVRRGATPGGPAPFAADEETALRMDLDDPLSRFRAQFQLPAGPDGRPVVYFAGNSLGLMPKGAREIVDGEIEDWAALAVEGHFRGRRPWYSYHEGLRDSVARLVGALPGEVAVMNSLTVNLHLMMATFYRPTADRHAVLMEAGAFPSDAYAVASQVRHHGRRPEDSVLLARPRPGEAALREDDLEALIEERGRSIALVLLPGVQYLTGQALNLRRLAAAARRQGCRIGFDLAHAVGNLVLRLHDWEPDFAVWCSYKYLNAGPGAVAGCFVHERHGSDPTLPRLAGWWGNDPATRFRMPAEFTPRAGADGWQVSNPPILSMAPLLASLALFDEAGMANLRERSVRLTGYLLDRLDLLPPGTVEVLTPRQPDQRGCQLSLRIRPRTAGLPSASGPPPASGPPSAGGRPAVADLLAALHDAGVVCDAREPDILRVAPAPLYNTFHEIWRFAGVLAALGA